MYRNYLEHLVNKTISKKNRKAAKLNLKKIFENADKINTHYGLESINNLL